MTSFVPYGTLTFCKNCGEQNPYHRELTDGEILNIYLEQTNGNEDLDIIKFAKELLKKASEK